MRDMQVFGILFSTLAIAVAQFPHRFSNPGFRNVRTPLSTAASKDNPYLSIPIVLMPDGKIVPKPAQISYQYLPQNRNAQQQNNQRIPKSRGAQSNYQVAVAPSSYTHKPKQKKVFQNLMSVSRRPSGANLPKINNNQPQQQYQNAKYMQQQNLQAMPSMHLQNQRNPINQQQMIANQPNNDVYKQNVLNFINFASHLGAQVVSQQRDTQKNQMQSTDVTYGQPEAQKSYENYVFQGPSTTQAQTDINMYLQSQAQGNSAPHIQQIQQQLVQPANYNNPQMQNQVHFQYGQPNARPQIQGGQQQSNVQNQAAVYQQNFETAVQFPGSQNNPTQANSYIQAPQQNYVVVSTPQETATNARPSTNVNFDTQSQMMKNIFNAQSHMEIPNYEMAQIKHQNVGNQNQEGQTYLTSDGHQVSFVNAAHFPPTSYSTQQNPQQQITTQNASPTVQTSYGQPGDQKVYVSYQNPQDLSAKYATSANQPQTNAAQAGQQNEPIQYGNAQAQSVLANLQNVYAAQLAGQSNGQKVSYRVQQQLSAGSQSAEPTAYTYSTEQSSYLPTGQKQDSSSDGGKLIYATSSAKQIHYSSAGQGYAPSQLKNNEEKSSPYAQFSDSSSSYKFDAEDDDDSEYIKQSPRGQFTDKQVKDDADEESEDEETSYKVVYIPLDILKNILNNNSVENQRSDKAS